jgi:cytochrome c553
MKLTIIFLLLFANINFVIAAGDPIQGKSKAIICMGCHGVDGNNNNPLYPILASQGEAYLVKQLTDFKSGARKEEHMSSMVEAISESDIPHIAVYFSQQKRKTISSRKNQSKTGELIYSKGLAAKDISACADCHGEKARGNDILKFPALAGQHAGYVSKMLKEFRTGTRHNDRDNIMRNIASGLSDDEIIEVAKYIATLN